MDGIYFDQATGLWYVVLCGIKYPGFISYSEAEKWMTE